MSRSTIVLPIVTIQPDFRRVVSEVHSGLLPSETIWISCYKTEHPSIHAKVNVALDEVDRDAIVFEAREGDVKVQQSEVGYNSIVRRGAIVKFDATQNSCTIACPPLGVPLTNILFPTTEFLDPEHTNQQRPPQRITAFDVSLDGTQFATGFYDGSVRISTTDSAPPRKIPKSHLSTVTSVQFFPSSRVLLTAAADFTLTILPADLPPSDSSSPTGVPTPARILKGHTRAITSTAIVSRGRNVLSGAKDGSVRLWDVGSGTQIFSLGTAKGKYTPITAMSIGPKGDTPSAVNGARMASDDREVDTMDKLVFCALQDGSFEVFDLGSRLSIFQSTPTSPSAGSLTAITYLPSRNLVATGSSKGLVTVYSTQSFSSPLVSFMRNEASIESLAFTTTGTELVVATDDGLPFIASVDSDRLAVVAELVGGDCEPVRVVRSRENEVWTAGDDGVVRVYRH
jgi:proteasomal ATPase-associated factor 1